MPLLIGVYYGVQTDNRRSKRIKEMTRDERIKIRVFDGVLADLCRDYAQFDGTDKDIQMFEHISDEMHPATKVKFAEVFFAAWQDLSYT